MCIFIVLVNYVLAPFLNVFVFLPQPVEKKTAGIVLCQPVLFFICFSFFVSYLPDMALWTKGTFQKDLTQVFESRLHLTLTYLLNCVQTEWRD